MNRRTALLTLAALPVALSGCARLRQSRLNPLNWFGGSRRRQTRSAATAAETADGRQLVREVTEMVVEQVPGGAIVRATGLPPTQGWWLAELKSDTRGRPDEKGVVTYRFLVHQPLTQSRVSTPQSRELTAAVFLSDIRLEAISEIVVLGETNSRASRR
jgi:hypothetical protein